MGTLTVIMGLCASGKSHELLKRIQLSPTGAYVKDEGFFAGSPEEIEQNFQYLFINLRNNINAILSGAEFCPENNQNILLQRLRKEFPGFEIIWVAFENNLEKANNNVIKRTNKAEIAGHIEINKRLFNQYHIPEGSEELEIHVLE